MPPDLRSTTRFSTRVADYVKYRPDYPRRVIDELRTRIGLDSDWVVADVGCGTGISCRMFLENGNEVIGVEPNDDMRCAAVAELARHADFRAVKGTAEATNLPDASVDLVVAAQAYHWFDHAAAAREWKRILRSGPGGSAVIMSNTRSAVADPFSMDYEALLRRHATGYAEVAHRHEITPGSFRAPFGVAFDRFAVPNYQTLDWNGLAGRARSSSYVPLSGHSGHDAFFLGLRELFDLHQNNGQVRISYDTEVFYGRIR